MGGDVGRHDVETHGEGLGDAEVEPLPLREIGVDVGRGVKIDQLRVADAGEHGEALGHHVAAVVVRTLAAQDEDEPRGQGRIGGGDVVSQRDIIGDALVAPLGLVEPADVEHDDLVREAEAGADGVAPGRQQVVPGRQMRVAEAGDFGAVIADLVLDGRGVGQHEVGEAIGELLLAIDDLAFVPVGEPGRRRLAMVEDDPARRIAHVPEHGHIRDGVGDDAVHVGLVGEGLGFEGAVEIDPQAALVGDLVRPQRAADEDGPALGGQVFGMLLDDDGNAVTDGMDVAEDQHARVRVDAAAMVVPGARGPGDGGLILPFEAEIGTVIRVLVEQRLIFETDVGALVAEARQLLRRVVEAAGLGFVVNDRDVAEVEIAVAAPQRFAAERGVVERDLEMFVEPADLLEQRAADGDAGASQGGHFARDAGKAEIAGGVRGEADEAVAGDAADAEDDAGVLDRAVRIEQLGADDADPGRPRPPGHGLQPAGLDDFGVVVEEQQHILGGGGGGDVVEMGVVERARVADDLDLLVAAETVQQVEGVRLVGAVVDDDEVDLVGRVGGDAADAVDAGAEQGGVVARRDDDGDAGFRPVRRRDRAERRFRGAGVAMEQDAGDPADAGRLDPARERRGPLGDGRAGRSRDLGGADADAAAEIGHPAVQFRREHRLEDRHVPLVFVQPVLVGVDQAPGGVGGRRVGEGEQGLRWQRDGQVEHHRIGRRQARDELGGRNGGETAVGGDDRRIGAAEGGGLGLVEHDERAPGRIELCLQLGEQARQRGGAGRVIEDDDLQFG